MRYNYQWNPNHTKYIFEFREREYNYYKHKKNMNIKGYMKQKCAWK